MVVAADHAVQLTPVNFAIWSVHFCAYSSPPHCGSASSSPCTSPSDAIVRTPLTPAHIPAYPPPDRETASRDLAVQVLANQVQELSGLVRQVVDGDRGRHRGRSSSGRRSRSRRGRGAPSSPRRVREVPPPRTPPSREVPPPRTPPRAPPPRAARLEPYGEDRRLQLERELYALLHEDDGTPYCWNIDEEILTWIADSVRLWSNRDRTLWLCDPDLPAEVQQSMGYPGHPWSSLGSIAERGLIQ